MRCTWLGQAGLLFEFDGLTVMLDPYLSDSIGRDDPAKKRRTPVDGRFWDVRPDVLILTHEHRDHADPETLEPLLRRYAGVTVLASGGAWQKARQFGAAHNYVLFESGTQWTQGSVRFEAVYACHSDRAAIGVLLTEREKTWYVTGDTLYHRRVLAEVRAVGKALEAVFLPVNGTGNNMNLEDAARFAREIGAKHTVPVHFGLFDALSPERDFLCRNKVVPQIFQEIPL